MQSSSSINELADALATAQPKIGVAIKNAVNPHLKTNTPIWAPFGMPAARR